MHRQYCSRYEFFTRERETRCGRATNARRPRSVRGILLLLMLLAAHFVEAQQEPTLPLSQRQTIDLAAGVPQYIGDSTTTSNAPQSHWLFEGTNTEAAYASPTFVESSDPNATWATTVVPYDANATRTFINQTSGGGAGSLNGQNLWFRLHFKVAPKYAGQKFLLNLEGVHTGVQVYINGTLLPGISAVAADQQATHVLGFVPVAVDLTPYLVADGATDNVIAIYASRGASWFETPGFSEVFRFGQAMAGPFRYVHLVITNPVHVPLNAYSNLRSWGTYVGTISEVPGAGTATAASALVDVQTNVVNESPSDQQVTLTTQIVDAQGNVLITASPVTETVPSVVGNPSAWPSGPGATFDQKITVPNPTLWYPNNSIYGTPYCYKVYHILSINGVVVDSVQTTLGIRTITWDQNFPYFNGHPMYLWGGGSRYDYPALGAAVPREQVWRDMQLLAAQGGNVLRPGHSTSSEEVVEAADALGIMIDQPSGDGEGNWNAGNYTADDWQLKQEVHRDMIVRDRSHPSILDWERDNGGLTDAIASQLATIESTWDHINTRASADRGYQPSWGLIDECDGAGCEIGNKGEFPNNPAFGAEYWDNTGTARGAWDYELAFAAQYVDDWRRGRAANAFGMAQWYAWDSPGEQSLWAEYQNSTPGVDWSQEVRSLGYSSTDQNRFPRFLYYIYQANWVPYSIQPVVHLAHHWNRAYEYTPGTPLQENAVSNCPGVRLLINGVPQDPLTGAVLPDQTPNPWTTDSSTNLGQNTTVMPAQVHWMVNWAPGTVQAVCLDQNGNPVPGVSDAKTTAGPEYQIVLSEVPRVKKPDGTSFQWTANGFDSDMIIAQVEDANGNIVPTATDNVTFTVTGEATYQGGTQQLVYDTNWVSNFTGDAFSQAHSSDISGLPFALYHSPRDPELNFEGGLQKIAIQSTFTPGTATVTASAPGLITGSITVTSVAPEGPVLTQAPAIIVPPADTATTQGYAVTFTVAASGSGTLSYQWYENGAAVGTNGSSYTIVSPTLAQNGDNIQVVVSSDFGTVQSNPVTLTVDQPAQVTITTQPSSQTVVVGQSAVLTVVAAGSPALTYQWYQAGSGTIRGANQPSYTTPIFTAAGTQSFYVVVGNPLGQLQSSTAVVTVGAPTPVAITTEPASVIVPVNEPVQFTAVVAGSAPYTYQWQFTPTGGSAIILTGGTQLSNTILYSIPAVTSANVGAYTVTVNNAASQAVTSTAAQITLAPPGVNLALDKTATSSSTQNACTDGTTTPPFSGTGCLGPENAVDGNLATRWGSATAGAPPTPPVPGVDPSWLQVDLGSVQAFNTVILIWENAYATQYQILYTSADPSTNPTWNVAISNNAGKGGTETLNFPTVSARYIRMNGIQRATQYGYSLYEFQVYNVPQCGGATERYTINPSNAALVTDNQSGLMWTRTVETSTTPGSQFTGVNAVAYCSTLDMRLPLLSEALGISGVNNATCAFPGVWSTWTSTVDPNDGTRTGYVNFDGTSSWQVTNNYPGATLCVTGTGFGSIPPAPPNAPTNLTATAASSSQINLAWTASAGSGVTYTVLRNGASVTSNVTGTSYSDTGLTASTTYSYTVEAVDSDGTSPASNTATATTPPAGCTSDCGESPDVLAIHAGGVAVGNFAADEDYVGGSASATTATISTAGVTNPAPEAVYQTQRFGNFTYTLPGLTTAASYTVRLHFSEYYWTAAGKRVFNVSINGTQVLTNFDIFAAVGGDQALVEEFTATANASGQIAIVFTTVSDNAEVAGIEVLASGSVPPAPPNAPTSLAATAVSSSQINLSWTASATAGVTYSVLRNGTGIANGLTATSYSDTGLAPSTTYSYTVEAVDSAGPSLASNTATATTPANSCTSDCGMDVLAIHAGGGAVGNFAADEDFVGGTASATTATISTTGVTDPAPEAVYQTQRFGNFTYMLPGLTAGTSYTVRLHFSEYYWTAAGKRVFNVSINGTQVLTNFDIFALVGADQAIVEQFTATANASGQIVIVFTTVSDNAEVAGIEVLSSGGTGTTPPPPPAVPNAPTNLMATAASSNQINLSWTASTTSGVTYTVLRNGASIANNLTATSYSDTGLMASTTYSYAVEAVDSAGTSPASNSAAATTTAATGCTGSCGTEVLAIHAGGAAAGNFATDEDYVGGSASATTATISTAGVSNPAPEAVYQTQRFGNFTYTVPGLTPGTSYTVRLHFSEYYWTAAGKRVFNVSINGTQVLTNFDIFALVGADQAIVEQFTATANASGRS